MTAGGPVPSAAVRVLAPRTIAWFLDLLVAVVAAALPAASGVWIVAAHGEWSRASDGTRVLESVPPAGLLLIAIAIVVLVVVAGWNQGLRQGRTGQSLGKQRLGIVLVDEHSRTPVGAARGLLRWVVSVVLASACLLTYAWAIVDARSRTWHDLLCSTCVERI